MKKVQSNQVVSVESTEKQVSAALFAVHDSMITATPNDRMNGRDAYRKAMRDLNNVRLAKGMQFLRSTDKDIIQDKLNLISDVHQISDDEFARVNLCPVLNQVGKAHPPIDNDMRELEAVQSLYTLFGI